MSSRPGFCVDDLTKSGMFACVSMGWCRTQNADAKHEIASKQRVHDILSLESIADLTGQNYCKHRVLVHESAISSAGAVADLVLTPTPSVGVVGCFICIIILILLTAVGRSWRIAADARDGWCAVNLFPPDPIVIGEAITGPRRCTESLSTLATFRSFTTCTGALPHTQMCFVISL